jgi:uridylate kinase
MPIVVFSLDDGNIGRVVRGEKIGTLVSDEGSVDSEGPFTEGTAP